MRPRGKVVVGPCGRKRAGRRPRPPAQRAGLSRPAGSRGRGDGPRSDDGAGRGPVDRGPGRPAASRSGRPASFARQAPPVPKPSRRRRSRSRSCCTSSWPRRAWNGPNSPAGAAYDVGRSAASLIRASRPRSAVCASRGARARRGRRRLRRRGERPPDRRQRPYPAAPGAESAIHCARAVRSSSRSNWPSSWTPTGAPSVASRGSEIAGAPSTDDASLKTALP